MDKSKKSTKRDAPTALGAGDAGVATVDVSDETLEATVVRAVKLLDALGAVPVLRAHLQALGYDVAEHDRGWGLLHAAAGFAPGEPFGGATPTSDPDVAGAVRALDAQDEALLGAAAASLKHRHPAQHAFVFAGLDAASGPEAVLRVRIFLDRLDALQRGAAREGSRSDG
jgi:hypothetical protein